MFGKIYFPFFLFLLSVPPGAWAAQPLLERITRDEALASTQLGLELSQEVPYRVQTSGQRVDLFLSGADVASSLRLPPEDGKIVKVLLARGKDELMISFLLRKAPARVNAGADRRGRVLLEIFWEEGTARPAIAFRVSGLPSPRGNGATAGLRSVSRYSGRWEDFFKEYRVPLRLSVPLFFSLPPRPGGLEEGEGELGDPFAKLIAAGDWPGLTKALQTLRMPADHHARQRLSVLRGEALVRTGAMAAAQRLLAPVVEQELPAGLAERATYLYAVAAASDGDSYTARYQLSRLTAPSGPYVPLLRLLQGEIALSIGKPKEALAVLEPESSLWPPALHPLRELRLADAMAAAGQHGAALEIYRPLLGRPELLMQHVFSLSHCAETLAQGGEFAQAAFLFEELAKKTPRGPERGLAALAAGLALQAAGDQSRGLTLLSQIPLDHPDTEAGFRARLKLLDGDVLSGSELRRRLAESGYGDVASKAPRRELREEAAFKQGLLLYLNGEKEKSVRLLVRFIRDFAGGALRPEAGALIRELIPAVVADLIARKEDLQALVLVEQTREDLLAGGMKFDFLLDVARASARLGLLQRASRVYLYLIDAPGESARKEPFYRPLVELAADRGEFSLAQELGRRYLERYPEGRDRDAIFLLRARALQEEGKLAEAADLLRDANPRSIDLELYAAELFWRLEDFAAVAECFSSSASEAPPRGVLLKAEALCRIGRKEGALPLFRRLLGDPELGDQAAFKTAELEMDIGARGEGLNLLRRLAEKGKDPLWRRLAGETLAAAEL